jgi:hypothetical protein
MLLAKASIRLTFQFLRSLCIENDACVNGCSSLAIPSIDNIFNIEPECVKYAVTKRFSFDL